MSIKKAVTRATARMAALFTVAILLTSGGLNGVHADSVSTSTSIRVTAEMYSGKGSEYLELSDINEAIKSFSKAVSLEPGNAVYHLELGDAHGRNGNFRKAMEGYTQAIRIDPSEAAFYIMRGFAYYSNKKYAEAIADFTKAVELEPNEASVYHSRGRIYLFQRDYDKAVADFTSAVNLDPKNAIYLASRGSAYAKQGLYDKAVPDFEAAVSIDQNHIMAVDELAKAEFALAKQNPGLTARNAAPPPKEPSAETDRKQEAAQITQTEQPAITQDRNEARGEQTAVTQGSDKAPAEQPAAAPMSDEERARAERRAAAREKLVTVSARYLGTPYVWGGMNKDGMDCSGFTSIVYKEVYNITLPRTSEGMYKWKTDRIRDVSVEEARAGDLVFFNHGIYKDQDRAVDHVGIYLGDDRFIHALPNSGVRYDNLTEYGYLVGIKRISKKQAQTGQQAADQKKKIVKK
jgi:cell wall-associated NlpC family hydrolase